jgi:2,3-dihydroxyphenylpropionate 1,2-dioxygenase
MTAARAFLGLSHTPLMGLNPIAEPVQREVDATLAAVRDAVLRWAPELVVLIGPDHYNGFFNELMPPFCIGDEAVAVGDYLTPAGRLNVDAQAAIALATHLMDADFDVAVSRRMRVDHGFSQALQVIWDGLETPPLVPIFMNAVAQPGIPRLRRCRALGGSIGRFLDGDPRRTLVIGSGGLSHEPPVPTLAHPDPAARERITVRREATEAERDAKTRRVMAAGMALASGDAAMKPLNPEWDRRWMDALADGRLDALDGLVLIALFLFWQCFHVFDVLKHNVRQRRHFGPLFYVDVMIVLLGAGGLYVSIDWLVGWLSAQDGAFINARNLGWLSGWLMVVPNALLAFFYAARRRADIAYASQVGDGHICIPLCLGLSAVFNPMVVPEFFATGLVLLISAALVHTVCVLFAGGLPRWMGWPLLAAYAWFVATGMAA